MADFDPDAYLSQNNSSDSFDPDAYLADSKPGTGESLARGFAQSFSGNFADEITGAMQSVYEDLRPFLGGDAPARPKAKFDEFGRVSNLDEINSDVTYEKYRDESRAAYQAAEKQNPGHYFAGNLAGAVTSPLNKLTTGMSVARGGALLGGINAAGASNRDSLAGQAADTAVGAGLGLGLGYVVDKGLPFVAKLTGSARDSLNKFIKNNPKATAAEIEKAAEMIGSKATPGMLTDSGTVQRLEQSLSESPSLFGQSIKNKLDDVYLKSQGAIDDMTEGATNLSPFSLGEKAKSNMTLKIGEDLTPITSVFNEVAEQTKHMPLSKSGIRAIQRNIENLDSVQVAGLSGKPAYYHERIGNLKNVDQLKQLGTLLDADMRASTGAERKILQAIKEKLRGAEESNINRAAAEIAEASNSKVPVNIGRDIVSDLKEARAQYAGKLGGYRDLSENSRLGSFDGVAGFLDNIDSVKSENFADKLFNVQNEAGLKSLQNQFPEAYEMLKGGALKDFKDAVMMGDKASMLKFRNQFAKLNPESKSRLFGDMASRGDAVSTLANNFPKNFNPSGTASQGMWNKEAITSNVTDIPRYAYYKLLTSDKAKKIGNALVEKSDQMKQFANQNPQGFANLVNQLEQKSGVLEAPYNFMRDVTPKVGDDPQRDSAKIDKNQIMNRINGTKFQQVLQKAAEKGDQSFNAAHYVLSQRDPEYRRTVEGE